MCISLKKDNIYTSLFLVISFDYHNPERKEQISFSFSCALSLSCVRLFATAWTVARQVLLSMGILQGRRLEWVVMPSSRGSSQPRDRTQASCSVADSLSFEPPGKCLITKEVDKLASHCQLFLY